VASTDSTGNAQAGKRAAGIRARIKTVFNRDRPGLASIGKYWPEV
jgi:hypothetical protein